MVYIYSLKLKASKYYIGKTDNPNFRLENHFDKGGSSWTMKYKPVSIHEVIPDQQNHDEQRITQAYMTKYGIDNVRGGPWCKITLTQFEKEFIKQIINAETDKCYECGSTDHFAKDCSKKKTVTRQTCQRCGRFGHSEETCFAKTKSNGKKIHDESLDEISWGCDFCGKQFDTKKGCIFHENVHCTKRRGNKYFDSSKALQDELYDSDNYEEEDIICYRCGRPGHLSTECYAQKHRKGYWLD